MASERGIALLATSTDYDWALDTGSFTTMTLTQKEGTTIGPGVEHSSDGSDDRGRLDAVEYPIAIRQDLGGAGGVADGTAFWLKVTWLSGTAQIFGGTYGFLARNIPGQARSPRDGRMYQTLVAECFGATLADVMEAES